MISYIMFGILLSIYRYQNVLVETEVKKKIGTNSGRLWIPEPE
ncbi:MAG: hypothetical protein ACLR08_12445 [Dorea longicatena]